MLADNLENILKVIGINDIPKEVVEDGKVFMDFHSDLFNFVQEGIENVSFLSNSIRRVTKNMVLCELRECVNGEWCRVKLTVFKGPSCRITMEVLGKDKFSVEEGFRVKGGA